MHGDVVKWPKYAGQVWIPKLAVALQRMKAPALLIVNTPEMLDLYPGAGQGCVVYDLAQTVAAVGHRAQTRSRASWRMCG